MTHLHWRNLSVCTSLAKMVSFGSLYDAAKNSPDGNLNISDVVMYLIPIGDRLGKGGLIAPNDDFGGRSVLAGYFPSITKQELEVALSSIGNDRSAKCAHSTHRSRRSPIASRK